MSSLAEMKTLANLLRRKFTDYEQSQGCRAWSRSDIVMGFVGDVGALAKLTMAADGLRKTPDHQKKLGHELADCLWSLLVIADEYQVNLEDEFNLLCDHLMRSLDKTARQS